jgi:DNA polymerase III delta prime subunit
MMRDLPDYETMHGPPVPPPWAARRICDEMIRGDYRAEALHEYRRADGVPVMWRIRARLASGSKWIRPMYRRGMIYEVGEPDYGPGATKPVYRLRELAAADPSAPVWWTEGEGCADAIARLELVATTAGSASSDERADMEPLRGRHVIVWPDRDAAGIAHGERVAARLRAMGCRVEVVDIDALGLPSGGDAVDWLRAHPDATADDLLGLARRAPVEAVASARVTAPASVPLRLEVLRDDEVTIAPVNWLWRGWLAAGMLHVLAGAPGTGKTTIALALAATLTSGGRWPDGTRAVAGDVLIWSGEDDIARTLSPRLRAMGAVPSRVRYAHAVYDAHGRHAFDPARDLPLLADELRARPVRLLIVDPIVSAIAGDSHKNGEVRRDLAPLVELAGEVGCAVLGISHFSKGTAGRDPVERVTGSLAFGAAARIVLAAAKRPDNQGGGRLLARAKSNLGPDGGGYGYELALGTVPGHPGIEATRVEWGEAIEGTARELLAGAEVEPDDDGADIDGFLRELLVKGPMPARSVLAESSDAGYSGYQLQRAARRLSVERRKDGMRGGWVWALPAPPEGGGRPPKIAKVAALCEPPPSPPSAPPVPSSGAADDDTDEVVL